MMIAVHTGVRTGRRDASVNGIKPPTVYLSPKLGPSRWTQLSLRNAICMLFARYAANDVGGDMDAVALRTVEATITRVTPLKMRLTPTKVPIAQAELDGHCM